VARVGLALPFPPPLPVHGDEAARLLRRTRGRAARPCSLSVRYWPDAPGEKRTTTLPLYTTALWLDLQEEEEEWDEDEDLDEDEGGDEDEDLDEDEEWDEE